MNRLAAKATMAALAQLCIGPSAHASGSADLGVSVAGPKQSSAGLQGNYIAVTNNGPDAATGVELIVQLTDGFDFQAIDGNCPAAAPCTSVRCACLACPVDRTEGASGVFLLRSLAGIARLRKLDQRPPRAGKNHPG